jgi:hypothetical protein
MKLPRWLNPNTNPGLYSALLGIAFAIWQGIQVEAAAGPLTWSKVGRVAAGVVFAYLSYGWQRSKSTPVTDPRDGNGDPLVRSKPAPLQAAMESLTKRQPVPPTRPPAKEAP